MLSRGLDATVRAIGKNHDTVVRELQPDRKSEETVARTISEFDKSRPRGGQLQIIQGAKHTRWAFFDFNVAPPELSSAYEWVCAKFVEDFQHQNPTLDLYSLATLRGIFSRNIQRRKGVYEALRKASPQEEEITRARDLLQWQDDPKEFARGIVDYVLGSRQEVLVAVMDNVDRLDLKQQLHAFQLALLFMGETGSFVILQMRDETYERFKNKPPLNTFRSGITLNC